MSTASAERAMPRNRLTSGELMSSLDERLSCALNAPRHCLHADLMHDSPSVDGPSTLVVSANHQRERIVIVCSSPKAPEMVDRAMARAREAKSALGPVLGERILEPIGQGRVNGLSYALLPYCEPLATSRPMCWLQRRLVRPVVMDWLLQVNAATLDDIAPRDIEDSFVEPLRDLASLDSLRLRRAAVDALERLDSGAWTPRRVLMHGDLWSGNILLRPDSAAGGHLRWQDRIVVIDWAGSWVHGHAMFDLMRACQSLHAGINEVHDQVLRHCAVLQCDPVDAASYLAAALAWVLAHLEEFPLPRFIAMGEQCFETLQDAHDSASRRRASLH